MPNPPKASANTASHRTEGAGATTETGVRRAFKRDGHKRWTFLWSDVGHGNETFDSRQTNLGILTAKVGRLRLEATSIGPIGIDDMAFFRTSTATSAGDVYGLIRAAGAITRAEIGELTGLSRTAVAARVAALVDQGLITEREQAPSTGGRPAALLTFNADAGVVLAAAIGRSRTRLAVCNLAGEILVAR